MAKVETFTFNDDIPTSEDMKMYNEIVNEMRESKNQMDKKYGQGWDGLTRREYDWMMGLSNRKEEIEAKYPNYDFKNKKIKNEIRQKGNDKMENKIKNAKNGEELGQVEVRSHHMNYNPAYNGQGSSFEEAKKVTMQQQVMDLLHKNAVVLDHVVFNEVQGERKLPVAVNNNEKTAIVLENEAFSERDYGVTFKNLECQKLGQMSVVSAESLLDSEVRVDLLIADQTAKDYSRKMEELILVGATPGKAEGVLVAEDAHVVEATGAGYDCLVDALYSLPKFARAKAVYVTDNENIKNLRRLVDSNGRPIMEASTNSIGQRGQDLVLGCPVVEVEATNLPDGVVGAFVDFDDALFVGMGKTFSMVRDDSMKRQYDQVCFVSNLRFGCIIKDAQCIAVIKTTE